MILQWRKRAMTLTHKIYDDLLSEAKNERNKKQISQRYELPNKNEIIFAVSNEDEVRHFYFKADLEDTDRIPYCNGIEFNAVRLPEYDANALFCNLAQAEGNESYIFETIIEDIRARLINIKGSDITGIVAQTLKKWQDFFAKNKQILMSPERQQGLYGELRFLEELVEKKGTKAVLDWSGCKYETHDFYINGNGVEIKTTSKKAPYKMHISSEYQLDENDVTGDLLVRFYAFRKSESDGERLATIIQRIRNSISGNPHALETFEADLEVYGYFDSVSEKYVNGYVDRETAFFKVEDGFPRIIGKDLATGISNCVYDVLIDECRKHEISELEAEKKLLKGNAENVR
jgi:hypothetical protein